MPPKKTIAKRIKDPNAPKRPLSAFLEYAAIRRPDVLKENPGIAFGAVGKLMGEEWRAMPEHQKAPYVAKAEAAKAQYDMDKANYVPDPSISLVPPKKIKDPNAPKRPLSAFLEYAAIRRPDILKENPGIAFGAVGKLMGEEWRAMPEDIKAPYVAKAEAAKAQYDKDKAAYEATKW